MPLLRPWILSALLIGGLAASLPAQAPPPPSAGGLGDLLVAPTRVVFEGRKRGTELNLSNIGQARATYRISLVRMEMDEIGAFKERPLDPGTEGLQTLFRFSPREVTLEPQESQTVRIQVRKPAELTAGEYRLHMVFRAVPPASAPAPAPSETPKGISIKLTPIYGIAIPLIVRHGETSAKVSIADPVLDAAGRSLRFRLDRGGNQSVYGDLRATLLPATGSPEVLAEATGLAVYTPNTGRTVTLAMPAARPLPAGSRIRITYALPAQEGGGLLAETILTVP
ncbi:MAG: fimbria/pilus periplasmic chaperone [Geothrix sp.]|nr:fimbria/pilus periplasmic chaperone [Geothrix sp.]